MIHLLKRMYGILNSQFGINPRRTLASLAGLPRYIRDYRKFRSGYDGRIESFPCLHDWAAEGGAAKGEYFWQDLYVARKIHSANPGKHVDIGSRVDGFVAHVASFREIEVFDIRPISACIPGVVFRQADLMTPSTHFLDYCDSLSCLHALEHFGLGRYGDPIDPQGHETGLCNMARMVRRDGVLYVSAPVGIERVMFNAHRVFDPNTIVEIAARNQLVLHEFACVDASGDLVETCVSEAIFASIRQRRYALGIFTFVKQ